MKVDFHMHTTYSDGGMCYDDLINECIKNNIKYISITDHNTFIACQKSSREDIHIINGMEIDVKYNKNVFHMLLYNFDLKSNLLKNYYYKNRKHEIYVFNKKIQELEKIYDLKIDKNKKRNFIKNNNYFDRVRINNFLVELGICADAREAFYNYTKVLKSNKRMNISMKDLFLIADDSQGIVSMAHPLNYGLSISEIKKIILELNSKFGLHVVEAINKHQSISEQEELVRFCNENNILISAGSDSHYKIGGKKDRVGVVLGKEISSSDATFMKMIVE